MDNVLFSLQRLLFISLVPIIMTCASCSSQPTSTITPVSTPILSSCGTSPSGQVMPIGDIPGWHQVFADDFNGTTLNTSNWYPYSKQPGGDRVGWWAPSHVIVSGCLLTLKGYKDAAAKSNVFVTGGIGMTDAHAQTYGKYLVRMRIDKGDGISAIALLWPQANVWPPEVDFYEDGGGNRTSMSATLHCGSNSNDTCQLEKDLTGYDFSQWHTLGVEWTAGKLVYTIDGTTWATVTDSGVPSIPMVLDLQSQSLACSQDITCLDSSTPTEVDMQVAWVVAYAQARKSI
ncbi:MAG TPA: glycoside hydrolase family 16 protein [Ktedonobacteraceae bacterium]|nr:glycoside hydrolase family 16 protein [Ktedonobacteraceae bacterium]